MHTIWPQAMPERPSPLDRAKKICRGRSVKWKDVHSAAKTPWVVGTRRLVALALRDEYGMGVCDIARFIERDHSTVSYLLRTKDGA